MSVVAGCRACGASFPVERVTAGESAGRCPECRVRFAPEYTPLLADQLGQVVASLAAFEAARARVADLAPGLRLDLEPAT